MLAFFGNLAPLEFVVVLVVAILVFGRDLPSVALRGFAHLRKLRRSLDDLRRETGIDRELRQIERSMQEAEFESRRPKLRAPEEERAERQEVSPPSSEASDEDSVPESTPTGDAEAPASESSSGEDPPTARRPD